MSEAERYMLHQEVGTIRGKAEQLFNKLTYSIWRRVLKRFRRTQQTSRFRIVDVGCGPGSLLACLETWFPSAELTGVDQSEDLLKVAKSRCKRMTPLIGDAC